MLTRPEMDEAEAEAKSMRPRPTLTRPRPTLLRPRPKLHNYFSQILHFTAFSPKKPEIFGRFSTDFETFGSKRALT